MSRVRVWLDGDETVQHLAAAPDSETARVWQGVTVCGVEGSLRWVTYENVDVARACGRCTLRGGANPPLEGDHPGPV